MSNGIIDFSLTTPLEKHLVTTITFLFAQIWDTHTEDKNSHFFSINCMFEICLQILYILNKIEKSEILSDVSMLLYLMFCQIK